MTLVPAHVGHWLAELMYVAPVLAVIVWISIRSILDRRNGPAGEDADPPRPTEPPS